MADDDLDGSWEALLENGALDKKFEEIDSRQQVTLETGERDASHCHSNHVILQEEVPRTQYAPPQPQMKILKRPSGANKTEISLNGERISKQPIKTLQQREAEYAEARLRILGAAKSEEDVVEERLAKMTLAAGSEETADSSESPSSSSRIEFLKLTDAVEVTRCPKGPDGSRGFHLRR